MKRIIVSGIVLGLVVWLARAQVPQSRLYFTGFGRTGTGSSSVQASAWINIEEVKQASVEVWNIGASAGTIVNVEIVGDPRTDANQPPPYAAGICNPPPVGGPGAATATTCFYTLPLGVARVRVNQTAFGGAGQTYALLITQ